MKKTIKWAQCEDVWFQIDIFKINFASNDIDKQIESGFNKKGHEENEQFISYNVIDAFNLAQQLITVKNKYNYAVISLNRAIPGGDFIDCVVVSECYSQYEV